VTKRSRIPIFAAGVALATVALFVACLDDAFEDGRFACDPAGAAECPPGLTCASDGRCRSSDIVVGGDVVAPDVLTDAAAPEAAPVTDACAIATWTVSPDGRAPSAVTLTADGRLFAGGSAGASAWVAEIDTCDGGVIRENVFVPSGTVDPLLQGIRATATDVVASGVSDDSRKGIFLRVARNDLAISGFKSFTGIGGYVGLDHIAIASDGAFVLGGVLDVFSPTQAGWVVHVGATSTCTAQPGKSVGQLLAASSGEVLALTSESDPKALALRRISSTCAEVGNLPLAFAAGIAGGTGGVGGDASSPVIVGTYGPTATSSDWGLVSQLKGTTWVLAPKLDPNPGVADVIQRAIVVGDDLFVALLQNASFSGGTPTLYRYALPITATSQPESQTNAYGGNLFNVQSMASGLTDDDALYIAGTKPGRRDFGAISRCRRSLGCLR